MPEMTRAQQLRLFQKHEQIMTLAIRHDEAYIKLLERARVQPDVYGWMADAVARERKRKEEMHKEMMKALEF